MTKRSGTLKGRLILMHIAVPILFLLGWTALPKFISNSFTSSPTKGSTPLQSISSPQVTRGRELFMGYAHFQNDGPPCMGCHSVGENGLLGGGAMGPDLTNVSMRRSQADIASILSNSGTAISPVMRPIFTEHPLTQSEQADLMTFLASSTGQPETNKEWVVIAISLAGFVIAVAALGFVYRGRLSSVRRALVEKAQAENR